MKSTEIEVSAITDVTLVRQTLKITGPIEATYKQGRTVQAHALIATWKLDGEAPVLVELSQQRRFSDSPKVSTVTYMIGGTRGSIIAEPMAAAPAWALALVERHAPSI